MGGSLSIAQEHLAWPFFDSRHREVARGLENAIAGGLLGDIDHSDVDTACRRLVRRLGRAGFIRVSIPGAYGGEYEKIDSRLVCLARETLAYHDALADFALAMQGLGTGMISLSGTEEQKAHVLPAVCNGDWIAAFALSEPSAGSDVAALTTTAREAADSYILNGEKTWISNGGIADVYTVLARTDEAPGARGLSAFIVYPSDPGFEVLSRIDVLSPHPLAHIGFRDSRIPKSRRIGAAGEGFKIAMRTLDVFRTSVAAAALGFARRALIEAVGYATQRKMHGSLLIDMQLTQAKIGDMAAMIDAGALLTYRAAWKRDVEHVSTTREAAMAKMVATENAQWIIDHAVQIFGGRGVTVGEKVESLYRDIRALRIYEGATEVQKLIIARETLKALNHRTRT